MDCTHQLLATERDIAFARICKGKISPVITQAIGPHVEAKKACREKGQRRLPKLPDIESYNVNANKSNEHTLAGKIVRGDCDTDDGDDKLAKAHASGTNQEEVAATETLDTINTRQSHKYVDNTGGDGDQEAVLYTRVLEESCSVIEDKVN